MGKPGYIRFFFGGIHGFSVVWTFFLPRTQKPAPQGAPRFQSSDYGYSPVVESPFHGLWLLTCGGKAQPNVIPKALQHEMETVSSAARMNLPHEGSLDARVGARGTTM